MAASTTIIADLNTVANGTFSATSQADAIAAAGPIQDLPSNASTALLKAKELKTLLTQMKGAIDGADPLLTTINNVLASLV